jgi:hypothetical protein
MAEYEVTLLNQTGTVWTLVVYITIPDAAGMLSVAWQVSPPAAPSGNNTVAWTDDPYVCLGSSPTGSGVQIYRQTLSQLAAANQGWLVANNSGALTLTLQGSSVTPGQIEITNNAGQFTNVALGYSKAAAVYSPQLASGLAAGFIPVPQYWVLLSQSAMKPGQVVANASTPVKSGTTSTFSAGMQQVAAQFAPPIPLNFPTGQTAATVTASLSGSTFTVSVAYSPIG